ncbi:MAG: amino acid ABC transporter permease [Verrucomicrobiae bacterium]|nr:amino acid ABC transporter permease [Verrucomicrobiae bacterium]
MRVSPRQTIAWTVSLGLGATFCFFFWVLLAHPWRWEAVAPYAGNLLAGWGMTLAVSAAALLMTVAIAGALTAGQLSAFAVPRALSRFYVEIVRGTPLLTQILIGFYLLAPVLKIENRFVVGVAILSAFAGAYLSEIFRGGILSIPKSQWEAARAIGLTGAQTYRHVVIPQAVRRVLPATAGQFANLVKDSSLLYVIGLGEFTMQAREVNAHTYATFESYVPLALGYLALTLPISFASRWMEERFRYEH